MIAATSPLRERFDAVLLDLDGTLLAPHGRLTPRSVDAVQALVASGFVVMVCTGRSYFGTLPTLEALRLDTALAAYNGAWIGRPGETPWRYAPIPDELVRTVAQVEGRAPFSFRHNGGRKVSRGARHPLFQQVAAWYDAVDVVASHAPMPDADLMRVSCYFDGEEEAAAAWEAVGADARRHLHAELYPMSIFEAFQNTDLQLLEIQRRGRGKAAALDHLHAVHGIPPARTVAIGDHRNDLPMLREAGLAVAMGNAIPAVRAVADLVIGTNADEGVAAWVEAGAPLASLADEEDA